MDTSRQPSLAHPESLLQGDPQPFEPPPSLYDQLGGGVAAKAVVDDFYGRVHGDPSLARFFEGVDMEKQRRKFLLFVTYALGGPDEYLQANPEPWPQLYACHERLIRQYGLNETHFDRIKELFGQALRATGAAESVVEQALAVVETTRAQMFPSEAKRQEFLAWQLQQELQEERPWLAPSQQQQARLLQQQEQQQQRRAQQDVCSPALEQEAQAQQLTRSQQLQQQAKQQGQMKQPAVKQARCPCSRVAGDQDAAALPSSPAHKAARTGSR